MKQTRIVDYYRQFFSTTGEYDIQDYVAPSIDSYYTTLCASESLEPHYLSGQRLQLLRVFRPLLSWSQHRR